MPPQMNMPPNYAMGGGIPMSGYPMQQGMNPQQQQQMMQRMQASQPNSNMSTPTPQRNFHSQSSQGTPTPNMPALQHPQFPGPPNAQGAHHGQPTSNTPQQQQQLQQPPPQQQPQPPPQTPSSNNIQTPQTPTFPTQVQGSTTNGMSSGSTPLSPGADPKDKERVSVILDINNELLLEAMQIQSTQHIMRKERTSVNGTDGSIIDGDKKSAEEEQLAEEYVGCMRRLQANLAYLAGLADKERKPNQPSQPYPAFLKPPTLNINIKLRPMQGQDGTEVKTDSPDREETIKYIRELYKKLQALFPDIDPNKEPSIRTQAQSHNSTQSGTQTPAQASPAPGKQSTPTLATSAPPQPTTTGIPAA
ncbi:hypothetical protein F4802DRAFT_544455 [Xylaria palmicola]|nr:hypothetical protein F4802DRAFT_544455 [Xylaria palmicola]